MTSGGRAERGGMALEGEGVSSLKKVRQIALKAIQRKW